MKYYTCIKSYISADNCHYYKGSTYIAKEYDFGAPGHYMKVYSNEYNYVIFGKSSLKEYFKENKDNKYGGWKSIEKDGFPEGDELYFVIYKDGVLSESMWNPSEIKAQGYQHYCLAKIPEFKKERENYIEGLSFRNALRVILDGGKVKKRNWEENSFIFINANHIEDEDGDDYFFCDSDYQYSGWIIVEPAPKPKMPEKLKEFKDELYKTKFIWIPRFPGDALCKLSSFLEDYADE